ncbi:hypothetical protein KSS87_006591 [Heliosperma pusillum]|nr:hypothetical protein KSS87_006591 [Heliosperma pusillum]
MFRRRFRMRRPLFLRVVNGVKAVNDYFEDGPDATGRDSFTPLQKCTMSIRMLCYGDSADRIDEYLRVGESIARECLQYFTDAVISHFGTTYLRLPTVEDTQRLVQIGASRGFPGMLESIDCMHWKWKNCTKAWLGNFQGRNSSPTVILEAIASQIYGYGIPTLVLQVAGNRDGGEVNTASSNSNNAERGGSSGKSLASALNDERVYHPCTYFDLAKQAFLKCLGLGSKSPNTPDKEHDHQH